MIYAPRSKGLSKKWRGLESRARVFQKGLASTAVADTLRNTRCEEFPAHRRHTVEVEGKDMADVLPQGPEQVEFRRIEVEGMPDSKVDWAKP
jgi:hypothetical protein